jgi:hypothetical protein
MKAPTNNLVINHKMTNVMDGLSLEEFCDDRFVARGRCFVTLLCDASA